jgi:hypothetical protein
VTDSWYVPARKTMVEPEGALLTALATVRHGELCRPDPLFDPLGETK